MAKPIPAVVVVVVGGILRVPTAACVPGEEGRRMKTSSRTLWRRAGEREKRQTGSTPHQGGAKPAFIPKQTSTVHFKSGRYYT